SADGSTDGGCFWKRKRRRRLRMDWRRASTWCVAGGLRRGADTHGTPRLSQCILDSGTALRGRSHYADQCQNRGHPHDPAGRTASARNIVAIRHLPFWLFGSAALLSPSEIVCSRTTMKTRITKTILLLIAACAFFA